MKLSRIGLMICGIYLILMSPLLRALYIVWMGYPDDLGLMTMYYMRPSVYIAWIFYIYIPNDPNAFMVLVIVCFVLNMLGLYICGWALQTLALLFWRALSPLFRKFLA